MVLLVTLSLVMLSEALFGMHGGGNPLFEQGVARFVAGMVAGFGIGVVAALLGVAGGELLIPTIVPLFGLDMKLAGSLSLVVSLPTMIVGFARFSRSDSLPCLNRNDYCFAGWWLARSSAPPSGA